MTFSKIFIWFLLFDFIGILVYTVWQEPNLLAGLGSITTNPWPFATAADLIFGLCLMAILIAWNEQSPKVALLWIVALFLLGNIATAIYLLARAKALRDKLKHSGT
jgi:hypothetical protein